MYKRTKSYAVGGKKKSMKKGGGAMKPKGMKKGGGM